jgi:filamentous hemagglutinin
VISLGDVWDNAQSTSDPQPTAPSLPTSSPAGGSLGEPVAHGEFAKLGYTAVGDAPAVDQTPQPIGQEGGSPGGKNEQKTEGLSEHEVGDYGGQKKLDGPGLHRDHIPSKGALIEKAEQEAGRPLTEAEKRNVINHGTSVAVRAAQHQQSSPTFGSRNTREQIESDAKNLTAAQERDLNSYIDASGDKDAAGKAAEEIRRMNRQKGITQ